jgi:hypothetical protein
MHEFDDLSALKPGPVEAFCFWTLISVLAVLCVLGISSATGLPWADYIHPTLIWIAKSWLGIQR